MERICECGCGGLVKPKNRFIEGHHNKNKDKRLSQSLKMSGDKNPKWVSREMRVCSCGCGQSFKCLSTSSQRFIQYHSNKQENNPQWKEKETRECACGCGETFECNVDSTRKFVHRGHSSRVYKETHFKSGKDNIMYGVRRYGKDSPSWKGGVSFEPYSPEFNRELKIFIRQRDGYTCQICGKGGKDVHHIDYSKKNNHPNNLITLCRSCHIRTNGE